MKRIIKFLNYPYPFYENSLQALKLCLGIGFFISMFCFLFKPAGLNKLNDISLLGFGFVTFVGCSFYMVILPLIFTKSLITKKWKVYKEILWIITINASNSLLFYYYLGYVFDAGYKFIWSLYLYIFTWTTIIAIIPAISIIFYKQIFVYKKIVKEVEKIDAKLVVRNNSFIPNDFLELVIDSENKKEKLTIDIDNFLFVSSSGNYVEVSFFGNNKMLKKQLIRNNISKVESKLKQFKSVIRCHRSHIVNINKVHQINGNLQGYQLFFKGVEFPIPVSRSYTKLIKEKVLNN